MFSLMQCVLKHKLKLITQMIIIRNIKLSTEKGYFSLYKFNLYNYTQSACVMGHFYSLNHPNAVFVNNFIISLILPKTILALENNIYHKINENKTN